MSVFNVLLGAYRLKNGKDVTDVLANLMKKELESEGVKLGLFESVSTQDDVESGIKSNKYDVVICEEELNGSNIGGGSVGKWSVLNPKVRFILLVGKDKKGGRKLQNLFEKYSYYDALYVTDLTGKNIAKLINNSRTGKEAFAYYGLMPQKDSSQKQENAQQTDCSGSSDKEVNYTTQMQETEKMQEAVGITSAMETVQNESDAAKNNAYEEEPMHSKDFEQEMRSMEQLFENEPTDSIKESHAMHGTGRMEKEPLAATDFADRNRNLLSGEDVFRNKLQEREIEDELTQAAIFNDEGKINYYQGAKMPFSEMTERGFSTRDSQVSGYGLSVAENRYKQMGNKLHVKGIVSCVLNESILMISFDKPMSFMDVEGVSNFAFTLLVETGEKGRVENGKFKTGILTMKGYGNCMVDAYTAIVEIVDVNLLNVSEKILEKNSNIVLLRQ